MAKQDERFTADNIKNLQKTSEHLRVLAHPIRLKIIHILLNKPNCVGELASACQISSQVISSHLRKLSDKGILKKQRDGRKVFYQIIKPVHQNIVNCLLA